MGDIGIVFYPVIAEIIGWLRARGIDYFGSDVPGSEPGTSTTSVAMSLLVDLLIIAIVPLATPKMVIMESVAIRIGLKRVRFIG